MMRKEILSAAVSFGAVGLFWLGASIRMDALDYGRMMQHQSMLLVIVALFSLRTYDLVFHLHKSHAWSLRRAYRSAQLLEVALTLVSTACSLVVVHWTSSGAFNTATTGSGMAWSFTVLLLNMSIMQGASAAYLRGLHQDQRVAKVDLLTAAAWLVALIWLVATDRPTISEVLGAGFTAAFMRPLALTVFAHTATVIDQTPPGADALPLNKRRTAYVLAAGQFTNLIKNNLLSFETLLLGQLVTSEAVAVFRVSRSFLNLPSVLLNISYQKTVQYLATSSCNLEREAISRRMTIMSLKLWGFSLPVIFVAAVIYDKFQTGPEYANLLVVLAVAAIASVPVVLQQSNIAVLFLDTRFSRINWAYGVGFLALLAGCAVLSNWMTLIIFILISGSATLVRFFLLRRAVHLEGGG
jgi:O-antigen/teichoic acid export membrane protein